MSAWLALLYALAQPVSWDLRRDESYDRATCGADVAAAAHELKVDDLGECRVQTYAHGGARIRLVDVDHGPVEDCPAGCFQMHARFVLQGGHAVPATNVDLPNPYELVRERIWAEAVKQGVPRKNKNGRDYDLGGVDGVCPARADSTLVTVGDAISWRIVYPTTHCTPQIFGGEKLPVDLIVDGQVLVPVVPTSPQADFGGLHITVEPRKP